MIREGISEEVTFEARYEGREKASHMDIRILGRVEYKRQGLEAGM